MERSQSYTSFETAGSLRKQHLTNSLTKTVNNNNNSSSNDDSFYKNKYASTSSLNLRKALELRQTQLQLQQREEHQRQQWQLLFEQQKLLQQQQQQLHQLQQLQQQQHQHSASSENLIDSPLYLSALNNLQILQVRRQKMLQRQKPTTSMDNLSFIYGGDAVPVPIPVGDDDGDHVGHVDDHEDEVYGVTLREDLRNRIRNCANKTPPTSDVDTDHQPITTTAPKTITTNNILDSPLPQKLLRFQRQRPHSEAAITCYRVTSPTPETMEMACSLPIASDDSSIATNTANAASIISDRRRTQPYEQALSFDSAISNTTAHSTSGTTISSAGNTMAGNTSPLSPRHQHYGKLKRDNSLHSDSSRYSSVDSLLEARKPDPEAILINLGFGPAGTEDILSRIPKRFLKPSQVRGIDTDAFVRRIQLATSLADHSVLGYRGLIGNPDLPPSTIVAKIMQRFEVNERKKSMGSIEQTIR